MKQQSGSKRLSTFARYVVSYMLVLLLALSALFLYMLSLIHISEPTRP